MSKARKFNKIIISTVLLLQLQPKISYALGSKRPSIKRYTTRNPPKDPNLSRGSAPPAELNNGLKDNFSHLDSKKEIPSNLLDRALKFFESNKSKIKNQKYLVIIDYKAHNSTERFYLVDMESGFVERYLVAHGKNSDKDFDGYATYFSNIDGSLASSLGFYVTAETYFGEHGYSLRLDGLSSTNSNARDRAIVIHAADYVTPGEKIGRSWGCPALDPRYSKEVIDKIKEGTLIYATNEY